LLHSLKKIAFFLIRADKKKVYRWKHLDDVFCYIKIYIRHIQASDVQGCDGFGKINNFLALFYKSVLGYPMMYLIRMYIRSFKIRQDQVSGTKTNVGCLCRKLRVKILIEIHLVID